MTESPLVMDKLSDNVDTPAALRRDISVPQVDSLSPTKSEDSSTQRGKNLPGFVKLSILMAVYNEEATLWPCVQAILAAPLPGNLEREIVLVDDCSTDTSWEIAQRLAGQHPQIRIFRQPANGGKGSAIRRAIGEMTGDLAIFQDADLE